MTYRGNTYEDIYIYDKYNSSFYQDCRDLIGENPETPYTHKDQDRVWRTQTCFNGCKRAADCITGFSEDGRPECSRDTRENSLVCVKPDTTCETYVNQFEVCFAAGDKLCFSVQIIVIGIAAANLIQIVFELGLFMRLYKSNTDPRVDKDSEK